MDHRCLYGHRISEQFNFAIQQRICPICGAPTVTLDGYKLARELAQEVPMDALAAFNAACYLESRYVLTPLERGAESSAPAAQGDATTSATEVVEPESLAVPRRGVPGATDADDPPPPRSRRDADAIEREFFKG